MAKNEYDHHGIPIGYIFFIKMKIKIFDIQLLNLDKYHLKKIALE